jgi:hypothetical protein
VTSTVDTAPLAWRWTRDLDGLFWTGSLPDRYGALLVTYVGTKWLAQAWSESENRYRDVDAFASLDSARARAEDAYALLAATRAIE